eukprot:scaffold1872_cov268-Chaetoceros_neogracile.AAC.19
MFAFDMYASETTAGIFMASSGQERMKVDRTVFLVHLYLLVVDVVMSLSGQERMDANGIVSLVYCR